MEQKSGPVKEPAEQVVKEIRRATRRQFSAEEKIRIVLSGLRGEDSIAAVGPLSITAFRAARCASFSFGGWPGAMRNTGAIDAQKPLRIFGRWGDGAKQAVYLAVGTSG